MKAKRMALGIVIATISSTARAQSATASMPDDWRPMVYSDASQLYPSVGSAPYAELWQQQILENDESYMMNGDMQYQHRHAPATDAHFVVRSPVKTAILSILDTGTGCTIKQTDSETGNTIKMCPMITAIYTGASVSVTRGRKSCFLELARQNDAADPSNSVAYASYDFQNRAIKLGVIMNHKPVEGCGQTVPIYPEQMPFMSGE